MNQNELNAVLILQDQAYRLLRWLNERARHDPARLNDEEFEQIRNGASCMNWLLRIHDQLPGDLRTAPRDRPALANLLAAFTQTSFERIRGCIRRNGPIVNQLTPLRNRPGAFGRRGKRADRAQAVQLEWIALVESATDEGLAVPPLIIEQVLEDQCNRAALILWSYAYELMRRSQFASQGHAVHYMWKQLDQDLRRMLSVRAIGEARSHLVNALRVAICAAV